MNAQSGQPWFKLNVWPRQGATVPEVRQVPQGSFEVQTAGAALYSIGFCREVDPDERHHAFEAFTTYPCKTEVIFNKLF